MSELKACPFCGGTPTDKSSISGAIWCEECHSVSIDSERWNTRPIERLLAKDRDSEKRWADEYHARAEELEKDNKRLRDALEKITRVESWTSGVKECKKIAEAALGGKNE